MTRHGSLAYYLAAWVCGGLFFAGTSFIAARNDSGYGFTPDARGLLVASFFVLAYGWVFTLAFAFALRRLARLFRWQRPWPWAVSGGILALAFGLACSALPLSWLLRSSWLRLFAGLFELNLFELRGVNGGHFGARSALAAFATILAGIVTAFALFRVDRAFSSREGASD